MPTLEEQVNDLVTVSSDLTDTINNKVSDIEASAATGIADVQTSADTATVAIQTAATAATDANTVAVDAKIVEADASIASVDARVGTFNSTDLPAMQAQTNAAEAASLSAHNFVGYQGYYDTTMPLSGTTNFIQFNELYFGITNITVTDYGSFNIGTVQADADTEALRTQVIQAIPLSYWHYSHNYMPVAKVSWNASSFTQAHPTRLDNAYGQDLFQGPHTEAVWIRNTGGKSYNVNSGWTVKYQHPSAKNADGSYNYNNWHLVGTWTTERPSHTTISVPNGAADDIGEFEIMGYSRAPGHADLANGKWYPFKQLSYHGFTAYT